MPSARANISAKFIAQIEIGEISVPRKSTPAEAIRPTMVSISGKPAATSEPKASTRIAIVTGQEMSSDLSIASRFARLKSDHIAAAPVTLTATLRAGDMCELGLEAVGGVDHRVLIRRRAGPDHGRVAVGRDRHPRLRRGDPAHGGIVPQDPLRTGDRLPELGRGCDEVARADDHLQRVAAGAGEVAVDLLARRDRLRAVRLPAGARERRLHARSEDAETDGDQRPGGEDPSGVLRRQAADPADWTEGAHRGRPPRRTSRLRVDRIGFALLGLAVIARATVGPGRGPVMRRSPQLEEGQSTSP